MPLSLRRTLGEKLLIERLVTGIPLGTRIDIQAVGCSMCCEPPECLGQLVDFSA